MAKAKENIKDLKNIGSYGYSKLTIWGMVGAGVLLAYAIISTVLGSIFDNHTAWLILGLVGLVLGILYAILGVFGIIKVVQSQDGKFWGLFLAGSIFAVLSPLSFFGVGGIVLAILAGISFLVYYLLEKK